LLFFLSSFLRAPHTTHTTVITHHQLQRQHHHCLGSVVGTHQHSTHYALFGCCCCCCCCCCLVVVVAVVAARKTRLVVGYSRLSQYLCSALLTRIQQRVYHHHHHHHHHHQNPSSPSVSPTTMPRSDRREFLTTSSRSIPSIATCSTSSSPLPLYHPYLPTRSHLIASPPPPPPPPSASPALSSSPLTSSLPLPPHHHATMSSSRSYLSSSSSTTFTSTSSSLSSSTNSSSSSSSISPRSSSPSRTSLLQRLRDRELGSYSRGNRHHQLSASCSELEQRKFYQHLLPSSVVREVEIPTIFVKKFTPDGKVHTAPSHGCRCDNHHHCAIALFLHSYQLNVSKSWSC
jgi:hypothetical protein